MRYGDAWVVWITVIVGGLSTNWPDFSMTQEIELTTK